MGDKRKMTKNREKAIKLYWGIAKGRCPFHEEEIVNGFLEGFIDCAEYLLLQYAELEKENAELKEKNKWLEGCKLELADFLGKANDKIAELEEENKVLAQNLEDTEILNKTYEKRFDDLKKENAELKKLKRECETSLCRAEYQYNYEQLTNAKEIILRLYNAGRDVLMCRAEEKAYDNLSNAINDKSIEQFLSEVGK